MTVKGGWISLTLPISPGRLLAIIEEAKNHAIKVSFPLIFHGIPKSSDYQLCLTKEGADGKPAPITPQDWSTQVLPWLKSMGDLTEDIKKQYEEARAWAAEHPIAAGLLFLVVGGVLIILVVYPHVLYMPILKAIGITSKGVSKNSFASAVQSWIGNIKAGSIFACSQSAATVGYGASTLAAITQTGAMVTGGVGLGIKWLRARERRPSKL